MRCGRRGCAAAEVLCCSAVPGTAGVSRRSPAERRAPSTAARGPSPPPARPLTPRPRRSKLPKTSAAARPAAPGEYLPVVGAICATLTRAGPRAWRGVRGPRRRQRVRGKPERGGRAARIRWRGAAEPARLLRCRRSVRCARPPRVRDESPLQTTSQITSFSFYFILGWGRGRGGGGGRPRLIDGPGARFANFQLRPGGRWEGSVPEPEAADLGALRGKRRLGRADSCFALSHPLSSAHTLFVRVKSGRSRGVGDFSVDEIFFFFLSPPTPEKKVLFASSGGRLQVEVLGEAVSELGGDRESLRLERAGVGLSSAAAPRLPLHLSLAST